MNIGEIDLHIHSTCSDGQYDIDELLQKCEELGLRYIGFVDHDTIKNFQEVCKSELAKEFTDNGGKIIVGTEFTCRLNNCKMHLIGYNFNYRLKSIEEIIKKVQDIRSQRLHNKIGLAESRGGYLTKTQKEALACVKTAGKVQIAQYLLENGYGVSVNEIIKNYLTSDKKELYGIDAKAVIDTVHKAGGFVVIAHPYQIAHENKMSIDEAVVEWDTLVSLGVDGMECYYSKYDKTQIEYLINFANKHNLKITVGSDYHGEDIKPDVKLGKTHLN